MRIVRRLLHVLVIVLTLIIGATAAAIIVSQTAWFKNWLRGVIVAQANQYLNGTLSIERLGGNLFFGVEMENIGVTMGGSQIVAMKDLGLKYNVFELISKGLSVDEIRLDKPVIYLRRDGDTWELSRLVKKQETEADRSGPAKPLAIDAIEIADGEVAIESPVGTSGVAVPKKFEHLGVRLQPAFEIKLNGQLDALGVDMNVRSSAGDAIGKIVADVVEPGQAVRGDLTVRHIDLAQLLNDPKQKSDITGNAHMDIHGDSFQKIDSLRGGLSIDSPRIVAAGYTAGPIFAKAQLEGG